MEKNSEFYIGYQPRGPAGIMMFVRRRLVILAGIVLTVALVLVFGQRPFARSFFDYGNVQDFEGRILEGPVPILQAGQGHREYVLVAEGKHGAGAIIDGLNGKIVRLRGTLIRREGIEMIEVADGSVQALRPAPEPVSIGEKAVGRYTLTGEIVDSKCYLGVMNPGRSKPHRECASLCIRGGIPPLFVVGNSDGRKIELWLLSTDGSPVNQYILDFVAEPVEISGLVKQDGERQYFMIDPKDIKRLRR